MTDLSLISILGVDLEVKHIPLDKPLALKDKAPSCVFLHEGLGSVAPLERLASANLPKPGLRRLGLFTPRLWAI